MRKIVFGDHEENTLAQFDDVASRSKGAALMADGHLGYVMPIGGVTAYDNQVSVVGVGFDIACGNAAIRTDLLEEDIIGLHEEIADSIFDELSFGVGSENTSPDAPFDHRLFDDGAWELVPPKFRDDLRSRARKQLGSIGSGNHYVDVFIDEDDRRVWVGVHFGSRGLGHTIASNFLALSQGLPWGQRGKEQELLLHLDNPLGHDYWHLMNLAGDYAHAGREWAARKTVRILGGREHAMVHNNHNFAWKETHFGSEVVVIRKGATPAFPWQRGFVGGSMGDNAVIVEGADLDTNTEDGFRQRAAMFSTVHGAGRVMSRRQAKGRWKKGRQIERGEISEGMMRDWIGQEGVVLRGGGLDEAPQAYRRLPEVLAAQGPTINILHQLQPVIVCMAS